MQLQTGTQMGEPRAQEAEPRIMQNNSWAGGRFKTNQETSICLANFQNFLGPGCLPVFFPPLERDAYNGYNSYAFPSIAYWVCGESR